MEKIHSFTQLRTWQLAREFAVNVYKETDSFPNKEEFGLILQMRNSSVSVASNIAEGFSVKSAKVKCNYYNIALESLTEIESHCYIAQDLRYLSSVKMYRLIKQIHELEKLISGLIKSAKTRVSTEK